MKYYHVDQLNDKLRPIAGKAIIIQKWVRRFVARRKLKAWAVLCLMFQVTIRRN